MTAATDRRPSDLHLHSTCSDGLLSPVEMMRACAAAGLGVVSLTDHDTLDGLSMAGEAAESLGLDLIPGLELTCKHRSRGTVHLLGYGVDAASQVLNAALDEARRLREARAGQMVERLQGLGLKIELEEVERIAGAAPPGRPHLADALVASGQASSRAEVFQRWLGDGGPGDVRRPAPAPEEGIELIHEAGGLAVLAHPPKPAGALIEALCRAGLDGVETLHPSQGAGHVKILRETVRRFGLLETGGSDCHGDERGLRTLHAGLIPPGIGAGLKARLARRAGAAAAPRSSS
jgi:predicted metal-dependent phosphoesterase TrpH